MTIKLDIIPPTRTAQQKGAFSYIGRDGKAHTRFYRKAEVQEAEAFLAGLLKPYKPEQPIEEPVALGVVFCFPYRASEKKSITRRALTVPHTVRPDLDNLEKGLLDTLTRLGFWRDDNLVWSKVTHKLRGPKPFLKIKITPFSERSK